MSYIIVIPSYNRQDVIANKTLKLLQDIPADKIYIFVANEEQKEKYQNALEKHNYNIVVGEKGITQQRNYIMDYFPTNTHIVSIDDDVEHLLTLCPIEKKLIKMDNIHEFICRAFEDLKKHKLHLFGIYPTPNAFYLQNLAPFTTNLRFIIGGFHGFINRRIYVKPEEKEDVHFTILNFMIDKGVLRYNHVSYRTKFKAAGGLGHLKDRLESNKIAAEFLSSKYPQYARIKIRKSGMYEIMLREFKTISSSKQKILH